MEQRDHVLAILSVEIKRMGRQGSPRRVEQVVESWHRVVMEEHRLAGKIQKQCALARRLVFSIPEWRSSRSTARASPMSWLRPACTPGNRLGFLRDATKRDPKGVRVGESTLGALVERTQHHTI